MRFIRSIRAGCGSSFRKSVGSRAKKIKTFQLIQRILLKVLCQGNTIEVFGFALEFALVLALVHEKKEYFQQKNIKKAPKYKNFEAFSNTKMYYFLTELTTALKASGWFIARSANTLRFKVEPDWLNP